MLYRVKLHPNGAPGEQSVFLSLPPETTAPNCPFTNSGYTFIGWSRSAAAKAPAFGEGDPLKLLRDTTLYALWTPELCALTFDANGGSSPPAPMACPKGILTALPEDIPARSGYTFAGWSTDPVPTAESLLFRPGAPIYPGADRTLYAQWAKDAVIIRFHTGLADKLTIRRSDSSVAPTEATCHRPGYRLKGWALYPTARFAALAPGEALTAASARDYYVLWAPACRGCYQTEHGLRFAELYVKGERELLPARLLRKLRQG